MMMLPVLLAAAVCIISANAQSQLHITPRGASITKPINDPVVFSCFTTDLGAGINPQLTWYDQQGREINDRTGRKYIDDDGDTMLKLYIAGIVANDAGTYTCTGRIDGNQVQESVELMLFQDITFDNAPAMQHPEIFTNAVIICQVTGQPIPTVSWRYEDTRVTTGDRYTYIPEGLRINNITEADNGRYTCRAEVVADGRMRSTSITVEVHIPTTTTEQPVPTGDKEHLYAHCDLAHAHTDVPELKGTVDFRQLAGSEHLEIRVNVAGLNSTDNVTQHGLHVHTFGKDTDGCSSMGGHWNRDGVNHGSNRDPFESRHPGDFGNMQEDGNGQIVQYFIDPLASLCGDYNIAGRGLVLHEHVDDLGRGDNEGSHASGNAGKRYGCCIITMWDDSEWD